VSEVSLVAHVAPDYALAGPTPDAQLPTEEDVWVTRFRAGNPDAFDCIMLHYEGRLLRFLTGVVGDVEAARELCQDTFLAAYQAMPRTSGSLRLSAWLHTIALNRARSYHRRRKMRSFLPFLEEEHASPAVDAQESVAIHDLVHSVLGRMPAKYAHVLLLQTTGGLSCREISDIVGCSEGAVKVRLLRARESFKKLYAEEEHAPCR
jgi:RNA polymerase sigma-70 factor (ECF subfamily)